jgi:hypothetical protein
VAGASRAWRGGGGRIGGVRGGGVHGDGRGGRGRPCAGGGGVDRARERRPGPRARRGRPGVGEAGTGEAADARGDIETLRKVREEREEIRLREVKNKKT